MSEWDNYCDEIGGVCKDMEAQAARIAELEDERDRMRKALQRISCYQTPIAAYWQNEVLIIVREALEGAGE